MITSICVLGCSKEALEFVKEYKKVKHYKKRDSDTEGARVHVVYAEVPDLARTGLLHRYAIKNGENYANVLLDGDEETKKEVTFSNDKEWLIDSNGHDTVVEMVENPGKYYLTLLSLLKNGYSVHLTSPKFTKDYLEEITLLAKQNNARVTIHDDMQSVLASLDAEYQEKLTSYRKSLYQDSLEAPPCGLPEVKA